MTIMTLKRRHDWRDHLNAYLAEIKSAPIDWGVHDCGVGLASRAIEAMTGVDIAAQWRGRYGSATAALRMLRDDGFVDLEALVCSLLPAVHPSTGQIGDIALMPTADALDALGVVVGDRILVLTGTGIGTVDLLEAKLAFRVG